jgi:hypothetical protein
MDVSELEAICRATASPCEAILIGRVEGVVLMAKK